MSNINKKLFCIISMLVLVVSFSFYGCSPETSEPENTQAEQNTTEETSQNDSNNNSNLEVTFFDVGQGDSALVTCDDKYLLIDGGDTDQASVVYDDLDKRGVSHLDYVVITHTDADHCGGVTGALEKATVDTCYCSEKTANTKAWRNVINSLDEQDKDITVPEVGDSFSLGSANVTFLAPTFVDSGSDNNNSLVCKIDYGDNSFMFTGDAETKEENQLISSTFDLQADVLKVSHHGSDKCTSSKFLSYAKPEYAVISVGKNSYGHPSTGLISRLKQYTSKIFRTDQSGDITFKSDGKNISVTSTK